MLPKRITRTLTLLLSVMLTALAIPTANAETRKATNTSTTAQPTTLAIVTPTNEGRDAQLADLITVASQDLPGVRLLDRTQLHKVLEEQAINLTELRSDSESLVIGKVLNVDLFAVVSNVAGSNPSPTMVTYDARTGIRLTDVALDSKIETAAAQAAASLRAAISKYLAPEQVRTICFLRVRNADLPSHMDDRCRAIAAMLRRRLTNSDNVAILERSNLEHVTRERQVAGVANQLAASVELWDIEIGRDPDADGENAASNAVYLSLAVTDAAGKNLATHRLTGRLDDPAELTQQLVDRVSDHAVAPPNVDAMQKLRASEAVRFAREAEFLRANRRMQDAVAAAEAAFALQPGSEISKVLESCLILRASELITPPNDRDPKEPFIIDDATLATSTGLADRAVALFHTHMQNSSASTGRRFSSAMYGSVVDNFLNVMDWYAFHTLRLRKPYETRKAVSGEMYQHAHELYEELFARYADYARREETGFDGYAHRLSFRVNPLVCFSVDMPTEAAATTRLLNTFLDTVDELEGTHHQWLATEDFQAVLQLVAVPGGIRSWMYKYKSPMRWPEWSYRGRLKELEPLLGRMRAHNHPLIAFYAEVLHEWAVLLEADRATAEATETRMVQVLTDRAVAIAGDPKQPNYIRVQTMEILADAMILIRLSRSQNLTKDLTAMLNVAEAGMDIGVMPVGALHRLGERTYEGHEHFDRVYNLFRLAKELSDSDKPPLGLTKDRGVESYYRSFASKVKGRTFDLQDTVKHHRIAAYRDQLPPNSKVLDWVEQDGTIWLVTDRRAAENEADNGTDVWSLSLADRTLNHLSHISDRIQWNNNDASNVRMHVMRVMPTDKAVYVATSSQGVYIIDRKTGEFSRLTTEEGLPTNVVRSMEVADGDLFLGLGINEGYLVRVSPDLKTVTTIVSSLRHGKQSPLDNIDTVKVRSLYHDVPRGRIIASVECSTDKRGYRLPEGGVWSIDVKTNAMKQIAAMWIPGSITTAAPKDHILLSEGFGVIDINLSDDSWRVILASQTFYKIFPKLPLPGWKEPGEIAMDRYAKYVLISPDYLLTSRPYGVIDLSTGALLEIGPPDGENDPSGRDCSVGRTQDGKILLHVNDSLWTVEHLPGESESE